MKQIDADRLLRFLNDWWLSETPDERMSEAERSEAVIKSGMIEDFMGLVETWSRGGADWHTENPPDTEKWYLVTLKKGKDRIVSMKIWTHDFEKWGWVTDADRVLAWAELPEPYQGDTDE